MGKLVVRWLLDAVALVRHGASNKLGPLQVMTIVIGSRVEKIIKLTIENAGKLVTEVSPLDVVPYLIEVDSTDLATMNSLGISVSGQYPASIYVTDKTKKIGSARITCSAPGFIGVFDNRLSHSARINLSLRANGEDCSALFLGMNHGEANLSNVFLRSPRQTLLWGSTATAVGATIEIEGDGRSVYVGDDCMLSYAVILRNHDMHTIFDLESGEIQNQDTCDMRIEQHVWVGQEALLLRSPRVGYGSIIGAKSFVKDNVPTTCVFAGAPGRVLRSGTSWTRAVMRLVRGCGF